MRSHRCVLLAALAVALFLGLGVSDATPGPVPTALPQSLLPRTQPGLSANEGVFFVTTTDDGTGVIYFIAQNARHSTLPDDLARERQLNPLWPVWLVERDVVLAFPEAAPVGMALVGQLSATAAETAAPAADHADAADAEPALAHAAAVADAPEDADVPIATDSHPPVPTDVAEAPRVPVHESLTYTVRPGDTLNWLSTQHGTTIQAIVNANGIRNPNLIYVGQTLNLPDPLAAPAAAEPADASQSYTVRAGDNLIRLSTRNGTTVQAIVHANGIKDPNLIYVGQTIGIPSPSAALEGAQEPFVAEQPAADAESTALAADPGAVAEVGPGLVEVPAVSDEVPAAADEAPAATDEAPVVADAATEIADAQPMAPDGWLTYTVRAGDTLNRLSVRHGTTVQAIVDANGIRDPDLIHVAQTISIPISSP